MASIHGQNSREPILCRAWFCGELRYFGLLFRWHRSSHAGRAEDGDAWGTCTARPRGLRWRSCWRHGRLH
uniref:Uncharacterized protein n=1 Tax=Ralstonia solanacearum TaxID=305 RepID=A0A0S4X1T8_RALSL|nr:protein of unknown function [Ralstonia solanacearum]